MNHEIHEIHETGKLIGDAKPDMGLGLERAKALCATRLPFASFLYSVVLILVQLVFTVDALSAPGPGASAALSWPAITRTDRPWTYWWWMGSAVDPTNITRELTRYRDAGLGGVHIIPIYGAKGWESNYISYLSPKWMDMLSFTVSEADRLGMGVDMTTGTGWCFGGPHVTAEEANASVVVRKTSVPAGGKLEGKFNRETTQALMAFGPDNRKLDLLPKLGADGMVDWTAEGGPWEVYAISQKPSGQKVKRAAPGGEGWMLNPFYAEAMMNYLRWFDAAFAHYAGPKPRAQYQDSYEYRSDWSPDFFTRFQQLRGYRLQDELPALFGTAPEDLASRVRCDYRTTVSDLMVEDTMPLWVHWSHEHGFLTRYEAHGAPGNLLDLYALADMPETEMFHLDRDKLVSKFASSAAHVVGRPLASSETGTWLEEHFTETLAEMKFLEDDMFLSGINHIFYHGTCYSPDEAGWPGWHFYASFEMNPRNSVWHDVPALNAYAARCQSVLQSGHPDNDILLYWPIYDLWSSPTGLVQTLTVHARGWLHDQSVGQAAQWLWDRGYQFDYVSDRQLSGARTTNGWISVPGGIYQVVVVPKCDHMPVETLNQLLKLANAGAKVIFQGKLPTDVPGLANLEGRRTEFRNLLERARALSQKKSSGAGGNGAAESRNGRILVGDLAAMLDALRVPREAMFDHPGLMCIRRASGAGRTYFIANRGTNSIDGWIPLATTAKSAVLLDPLTARVGIAAFRARKPAGTEVYLQLAPGESILVRALANPVNGGPPWAYAKPAAAPIPLQGTWTVKFIRGGPELPATFKTQRLASWTELGDTNAQRFAGTALYTLQFDMPTRSADWRLDLGKVCQSARVRLNGHELGTLFTPPFRVQVGELKHRGNVLEIEVTNVSANRIRDLDRRGVPWKNYHDINFVNLNYRPFNAADWPLTDSGLIGPVTLTPLAAPGTWTLPHGGLSGRDTQSAGTTARVQ